MFDAETVGWRAVELAELATIKTGKTPSTNEPAYWDGDVPFVTPSDMDEAPYLKSVGRYLSPDGAATSVVAPAGAVLFTCIGATIGKACVLQEPSAFNQQINACIPRSDVDPYFLFHALKVRTGHFKNMAGTTAVPIINKSTFSVTAINIPSLDEQRRIAEVLRSVDGAIVATEAVLSAAAAVRLSALDALMRALVEEDGYEHILSDVAEVRTGLAKNKNANGRLIQLPYLRVANVQDGWFDLSDMQEIAVEANKVERYSLKDGDVLLTEGGDYDKLGRGGVWKAQVNPCLHQNHVFCVRSDQTRLVPEFLALVTQSYLGRAYFLSCAKRTTNLASINSSQLKALPVPLPNLERQFAVIAEIGCIDAVIELEEEKLRSLQRLRASQGADLLSGRVRVPA